VFARQKVFAQIGALQTMCVEHHRVIVAEGQTALDALAGNKSAKRVGVLPTIIKMVTFARNSLHSLLVMVLAHQLIIILEPIVKKTAIRNDVKMSRNVLVLPYAEAMDEANSRAK